MKIGFPRALYYFDYYPFWAGFFYKLNIQLETSPPTHRTIMETGLKMSNDDTCLPVKLLAGHLQSFKDVDAVFIPRMVSMEEKTYLCPKLLGLPESVLSSVPKGMPVLTVTVNFREGKRKLRNNLREFGRQLGKSDSEVSRALTEAQQWLEEYGALRRDGWNFEDSMNFFEERLKSYPDTERTKMAGISREGRKMPSKHFPSNGLRPSLALVGHSYLTYESYANLNLLSKLQEKADVVLVENVDKADIEKNLTGLRKKMFWSHSKRILGAGNRYVSNADVDGIIYLSCFGCGTDSMTQDILARQARFSHRPYMVLTLDEHSGEAGVVTRIEAFVDMIERSLRSEDNLSAYGERLDSDSNTL